METGFYRAFEEKYRGGRDLIKLRLRVYLPFIEPLKLLNANCKAVDLGCGRGEWLELLRELGIDAHGIDLDDGMLAACRERGLSVETGDAISFIKSLPDESQTIVSGFHIIEHISFTDLQILVQEALRVLKPAGLLILETPNPENIIVGTTNFYLDPTHLHPIPPQLLAFLPEYYGFFRTKILRLQESLNLAESKMPSLLSVFDGVSPDYSIIAQKNAPPEALTVFNRAFGNEYGLTLKTLATNYDTQAETKVHQVALELESVRNELSSVHGELESVRNELSSVHGELESVRNTLRKITAPVRFSKTVLITIFHLPRHATKGILAGLVRFVRAHPGIKRKLVRLFSRFPMIDRLVLRLSRRAMNEPIESHAPDVTVVDESQDLSLRAQQIHKDLLDAVEQNKAGR